MPYKIERTTSPQEARHEEVSLSRVSLYEVRPGSTVTITTAHGSQYWIVVTNELQSRIDGRVAGLSVTTSSKTIKGFGKPPAEITGDPVVEVGRRWGFGRGGSTSEVTKITVS